MSERAAQDKEKKERPGRQAPPKKAQAPKAPTRPVTADKTPAAKSPMQSAGPSVSLGDKPQAKAKLGKSNDPQEHEADDVAARVADSAPGGLTPEPSVPVVRRSATAQAPAPDAAQGDAAAAIRARGDGVPLASGTRHTLEGALGSDLSSVRVHQGQAAASSAAAMGARAFTHGNDIWLGAGESQSDLGLMAHEATHVVQQDGAVRRAAKGSAPSAKKGASKGGKGGKGAGEEKKGKEPTEFSKTTGELHTESGRPYILFDQIEVPQFKVKAHNDAIGAHPGLEQGLKRRAGADVRREMTRQRDVWILEMRDRKAMLSKSVSRLKGLAGPDPKSPLGYVFSAPSADGQGPKRYAFGKVEDVAADLALPTWTRSGKSESYQVDHQVELQLANWGGKDSGWANQPDNMQLLEGSVNMSSGPKIAGSIKQRVKAFVDATGSYFGGVDEIKAKYDLVFEKAVAGSGKEPSPDQLWRLAEIDAAKHLGEFIKPSSLSALGRGLDDEVLVYPNKSGGSKARSFTWAGKKSQPPKKGSKEAFWWPLIITEKQFSTEDKDSPELGTLTGKFMKSKLIDAPEGEFPFTVWRAPGALRIGGIDQMEVRKKFYSNLKQKNFSPIMIEQLTSTDEGMSALGKVNVTLPLMSGGITLDLVIADGDVKIGKTFGVGDFRLPAPLSLDDCSLSIFLSEKEKAGISGQLQFSIKDVGQGSLAAAFTYENGLSLSGSFNFDSELFTKAEIGFGYNKDGWSGEGALAIGPGKVTGIKNASLTAKYAQGTLSFDGQVQPSFPYVKSAQVSGSYSEKDGLMFAGRAELSDEMPLVKGGTLEAKLTKNTQGYQLAAAGVFPLKLPGEPTVQIAYANGALDVSGSAAYKKGMLNGSLSVGATTRPVDDKGNPVDGPPSDKLTAYGSGTLTAQLSPWLKGTIGATITRNGEVELVGEIAVPDTLTLFDRRELNREIFHIGVDIPIVGVAVLGQKIGIFATIGGGLEAYAGVGPGQLRNTKVAVKYNPDREDQTEVRGTAEVYVPASAGVRLSVNGSIGAGIPVVSARAGLELGGTLAIEGAASAAIEVVWTPAAGLSAQAEGKLEAQPKFIFDITGFVKVEADLGFTTKELYGKKWQLAAFEYGSGLTFGVIFPVRYQEGKQFDISLSDVKFNVPDVNPKALLTDLFKRIA